MSIVTVASAAGSAQSFWGCVDYQFIGNSEHHPYSVSAFAGYSRSKRWIDGIAASDDSTDDIAH